MCDLGSNSDHVPGRGDKSRYNDGQGSKGLGAEEQDSATTGVYQKSSKMLARNSLTRMFRHLDIAGESEKRVEGRSNFWTKYQIKKNILGTKTALDCGFLSDLNGLKWATVC